MAVPKAKMKAMISGIRQRTDPGWSHSKGRIDLARRTRPRTMKTERMINPRATQEVLGFKQAYMNLHLIPRSKTRKGAPMATMIGPHRIGRLERFRAKPKASTEEWMNGEFDFTPSQWIRVPMINEPAPIPAR